ncbi:hypothetical protein BH23GEM3_BH23GEM3_07800 [soil metagenome]|nr:hypothetical protein [Gemmatimonadota bacterium]
MKRPFVILAVLLPLAAAACGREPQVVVEAATTHPETGARQALADLPVRLLPYDRDAIFDSLEAAFAEPEPALPPELLEQQRQIQTAETEWRTAEERWGEVRDSLRVLAGQLQQMGQAGQRATPQYVQAFRNYERLESEVSQVQGRSQNAFQRYDQLQRTFLTQADSIRVVREQWGERAFADFDRVVDARLQQAGREEYADTTGGAGVATFRAPTGRWWVYARYRLPFEELYWNVPLEVTGDSVGVVLTRENAQVRPAM